MMGPLNKLLQHQDSDRAARTVRQLLAKHQENVKQASVTPTVQSTSSSPKFNEQNGGNFTQTGTGNSSNKSSVTTKHSPDVNGRVLSPISSSSASYFNKVS